MEHENFKEFNPEDGKSAFEKAKANRQYWEQQIKKSGAMFFVKDADQTEFLKSNILKLKESSSELDFEV